MDVYSFPVQLIVSHPNGTVIHTLNLNEFMAVDDVEEEEEGAADNKPEISSDSYAPFRDDNQRYIDFLVEGLKKSGVLYA